ncbi:hypothetical protein M0G43_07965 [Subsaxibacter sp. CAU 1640]|uniref:DUF6705 family protein n=1 Tax=Subsaxibacter sp. CAU 1640 TaxID=2933271 RepID=UPI0020067334|nr:DUF6705 family protein [Subsaxibacter sp. CAU 1640]MCK7590503.1 hypothetical protein [Subsaxibacter sp. CAU 1640]
MLSCKSQSPVVGLDAYRHNTVDGAYFKDLNNELNKFEGTWVCNISGMTFTIKILKKTMVFNGKDYEDILIGEYKYVENGNEVINTLANINNSNSAKHNIYGRRIIANDMYVKCDDCLPSERRVKLFITDSERKYLSVSLVLRYLTDEANPEKMTATIKSNGGVIIPDDNSPTSLRVPYGEYLMIKQ